MPQIANQDYNLVKATPGIANIGVDAHVLGELKRHFLQGTIFDVIIDEKSTFRRVVAANEDSVAIAYMDLVKNIAIDYTLPQCEGLAAIQQAAIAAGKKVDRFPELYPVADTQGQEVLVAKVKDGVSLIVLNENGNGLVPDVDGDGNIAELLDSGHRPEVEDTQGYITISSEDIQKLIGLPISEI